MRVPFDYQAHPLLLEQRLDTYTQHVVQRAERDAQARRRPPADSLLDRVSPPHHEVVGGLGPNRLLGA